MILHILLWILKIIGIAIAVLLGLLLLLIGIVLFVPVRYKVFFCLKGTSDSLEANIQISWFLHLVAARIHVNGTETDICARAAWKKFLPAKEKQEQIEETEDLNAKEKCTIKVCEPEKEEQDMRKGNGKTEQHSADKDFQEGKKLPPKEEESDKESGGILRRKIVDLWNRVKAIWEKIKYTITGICGKIEVFIEKKDHLTEFLAQEEHKAAFSIGLRELQRLMLTLKPKELHGTLHFGFSDPYLTGNTLAFLSMLYPFIGDSVEIIPEFETCVLEGEVFMKGKLRVGTFVRTAVRLLRSRELRMTVRDIKTFRW